MRRTTSHHHEVLRPSDDVEYNRNGLNLEHLVTLLDIIAIDHALGSTSSGKKRSSPFPTEGNSKRAKISASSANHVNNRVDNDDADPIPSLHHTYEIQYTMHNRRDVRRSVARRFNNSLESQLIYLLSEPQTIDLGNVYFRNRDNRLMTFSSLLNSRSTDQDQCLILLPTVHPTTDLDAFDFAKNVEDILMVSYILVSAQRATMDAHLQLTVSPSAYDEDKLELSFHLQLDVCVSLVLPALVNPFTVETKRGMVRIEEAQRRFLDFSFSPALPIPISHQGETDIPFFYSVLGPAQPLSSKAAEAAMQHHALLPKLLPFQRRSVGWLLDREGKTVTPSGEIVARTSGVTSDNSLPAFWEKIVLGNNTLYTNRLTGIVAANPPHDNCVMGGILAEEPGLGKTLMCISLILLNPAPGRNPKHKCWDPIARLDVKEIKTSLIVTPASLAPQWADELALHAPTLTVFIYDGWSKVKVPITQAEVEAERQKWRKKNLKASSKASSAAPQPNGEGKGNPMEVDDESAKRHVRSALDKEVLDWCSYINTFDVCITTYDTLRHDLTVARPAPIRPRREDVVYSNVERRRSPLVMCEWYRVIMDEVQMAGSAKIEDMVSLIPRLSSFAVSGTPARSRVSDLLHVLKFLRVDDTIGSHSMWNRLLKPGFAYHFQSFFQQHAIRTMKSYVKDELTIPQQTRFLVSIDLGRVERHVYDQSLEASLLELGLDARGVAVTEGWEVNTSLLRSILRRLRGICTHPQVGQLQKLGENLHKQGALKSMTDVLEAMKDQNWRNLMDDRKSKIHSSIRSAQLQKLNQNNPTRYRLALETLLLAEKETKRLIDDVKAAMSIHEEKGDILKKEAAALRESRRQSTSPEPNEISADKGKGKALDKTPSATLLDGDADDQDLPRTLAGEEHAIKRRTLQLRLRECYITLHRVKFLQGDVYHVLGGSYSPSEDEAYEAAEDIRQDLLRVHEDNAMRAMKQLNLDAATKGLTKNALLITVPYCEKGGIRSRHLTDEADEIIDGLLNEQSKLLWSWRSKICTLLTQKLSAGGDEADGQEYTRTLETQGEAETYLQAYAALLADRREAIIAERTLLAAHDTREKRLRHTKAAIKAAAAAAALETELDIPDEMEPQPEHDVLRKELSDERKSLLKQFEGRALKSVAFDLSGVLARIPDKDPEKVLVRECAQTLRQLIASQGTLMEKLETDLNQFRKAFNERILYFRQLQELSDTVAEVTWDGPLDQAIQSCNVELNDLEARINTSRARQRYMDHLARNKEQGTMDEDDESCILCRCAFTRGYITQCAHVFCADCLDAWLKKKDGKACPVCRVVINTDQMQRFAVQDADVDSRPPPKPINGEPAPRPLQEIQYNMIDRNLLEDIQSMEVIGSYGSKIQTLTRHLLYLQANDPLAKSIVFSAWADSLYIIEHALRTNGVPCLRIDQNSKKENAARKFRTDPTILVLLLHGERENAGLNLTCASRVFLVESVVHHGFELQAIARIDRMSQLQQTEVYCYYAEDTVERNILDLAARRGQSLYTKDSSAGTLQVSSFALETEKHSATTLKNHKVQKVQKGDFIFKTEDMLAILFPHIFFPLDYVEDESQRADLIEGSQSWDEAHSSIRRRVVSDSNAEAGPSRLH